MNLHFKQQSAAWLTALFLLVAGLATAQTTTPTSAATDKINATIDQANTIKSTLSPFFSRKAKDTVFVLISNIKYTDPNLSLLKNSITAKSKVSIKSMQKDGIVILKVIGKNDASSIYDALDKNLQKIFEAGNMEDNRLVLEYKAP